MKVRSLAIAALLGLLAANSVFAQAPPADTRVRLEVVLNQFEGATKTGSLPFLFSLALHKKGSLRVEVDPAKSLSALLATCPFKAPPAAPSVFSQVESTVVPASEGRFSVNLVFTERALVGCQELNGVSIPVFSNKTVEHGVSLKDGESREIALDGDAQRNESTRASVTLTIQN